LPKQREPFYGGKRHKPAGGYNQFGSAARRIFSTSYTQLKNNNITV
jgi:hypothetical protein